MNTSRSIPWRGLAAAALAMSAFAGCSEPDESVVEVASEDRSPSEHVEPDLVASNPPCPAGTIELKIEPVASGTYGDGVLSVTIDVENGTYFDWTSNLGIDAVIAKGGPDGNVYTYDPPEEETSDTGLHAPINSSNGQPYGLSHISFCYDLELEVTKTAETSYTSTCTWDIDKVGDESSVLLPEGGSVTVSYDVTVDATCEDSDWAVEGEITIVNPAPTAATITSVADVIDGTTNATVDCGVTFPYVLAAGETLTCTYEAALPDGDDGVNTVTVTTSGAVGGDTATADVDFGDPTTVIDDCISVSDDPYGDLLPDPLCLDDLTEGSYTFEYDIEIGPVTCEEPDFVNEACFVTDDTDTEGCDDHTVVVDVNCDEGCTLTPGYWKTHSVYGPARYDDNWALVGENTAFLNSGVTWYQALWTSPGGNAYWILAHAYIAAYLNVLNGASVPAAVTTALGDAEDLLQAYTPAQIAAMSGGNPVRKEFIALARILDDYNNGLTGPGHCTE